MTEGDRMKFLVLCAGGNIRSRAIVHHLMYRLGKDALSASHEKQPEDTLAMLCAWADRIVVAQPHYVERINPMFRDKVKVIDVGPDSYGSPWHFILQEQVTRLIGEWEKEGFAL